MDRRLLAAPALALLLSGCASVFSSYPAQADKWVLSYQNGQVDRLVAELTPKLETRDGVLYALELGRLAQLGGQTEVSKTGFETAFRNFVERDDQATLRASAAVGGAGAMLSNDNALPYVGKDYERIFAHSYQALNFLKLGNYDGAAVELRRANLEQEAAAERRQRAIAKAEQEAEEQEVDLSRHEGSFAGLNAAAGRVRSSFQNAYTFYFSAVFWEAARDYNAALIDLRRAFEINPDAVFIEEDIRRVSRRRGDRVADARVPGPNEGSLVVFFEQGRVPSKREISLPIPTIHGAFAVAFPTYDPADIPAAVPLTVVDAEGNGILRTQVIAEVGAMAARSLREDMPGMLVRQTLRAATKYAAQKQANDANPWAGLATNLYNLVSEQADLRSWNTLPVYVQAGRTIVPAGEKQIMLSGAGVNQSLDITVSPGGTTVVRVVTMGGVPVVETYRL
jgi:uncharacterized protein